MTYAYSLECSYKFGQLVSILDSQNGLVEVQDSQKYKLKQVCSQCVQEVLTICLPGSVYGKKYPKELNAMAVPHPQNKFYFMYALSNFRGFRLVEVDQNFKNATYIT